MTKTREYQTLLDACSQEGCPLCRVIQASTQRYLDAWKYELFTDVAIRQELRQTQGFCHSHTWQLVRMGANIQLAQSYRDILTDSIEALQQGNVNSTQQPGLLRRFFENKSGRSDCPACRQQTTATERYIHTLRQSILDDAFCTQLSQTSGLCLEHFRLTCEQRGSEINGPWLTRLRQVQLHCLQQIEHQLNELIRKHDYRFRHELRGPEMHSWRRAAGLVAGEDDATRDN